MSAYSDQDITMALSRGRILRDFQNGAWIEIDPIDEGLQVQPASVDLKLGNEFMYFSVGGQVIDLADRKANMTKKICESHSPYELQPGGFVLGTTVERVHLGPKIVGKVEGKSSLGRIGLTAHVTAGFIDPGFNGQITLELYNASPNVILLRPGVFICQLAFFETDSPAQRPYGTRGLGSRYQNQTGVQAVKK